MRYYLKNIAERLDLYEKIPYPNENGYNVDVLNISEVNLLFEHCENDRELLIVQALYETGIRSSELVKLNLSDIDFHNKSITIRESKNRKTRTVYFGDNLLQTLTKYLNTYQTLFSDKPKQHSYQSLLAVSKRNINYTLGKIVKRSSITKKVNVHTLRHTFAVHYLNFGGTLYRLQKLLGHSRLSTTFNYLQYAILLEGKHVSLIDKLKELEHQPQI